MDVDIILSFFVNKIGIGVMIVVYEVIVGLVISSDVMLVFGEFSWGVFEI